MSLARRALRVALGACALTTVASGTGLLANHLREGGIPLVAPFPYEQDCPDKTVVPEGPTIGAETALALARSGTAILLDARPAEAFAAGHLPGARSLPYSFVTPVGAETARGLRAHRLLVVYCDSPGDKLALLLAGELRGHGLERVQVLRGGLAAAERARSVRDGTGAPGRPAAGGQR